MGYLCPLLTSIPPETEGNSEKRKGKRWRESNLVPDTVYTPGKPSLKLKDLPRTVHSWESQYKVKDPEKSHLFLTSLLSRITEFIYFKLILFPLYI